QQYRVATTGLEHGDDGIEQAGDGTSPAQLVAAAAAAVPRRHHRPRAWGRRHRANWGRHKPNPASSGGSGSSTAAPPPPASSMEMTASSKLGTAQAQPS
ncbi:hypothetical protein PF001_g33531, partial [Phytophthora fragariae]